MSELRFDGQVIVITGGAGALGRAYADLIAARGGAVVVNDLGGGVHGGGGSAGPAQEAAAQITAAGGIALADTNDVSSSEGARATIAAALERFGRIDAVIANAGTMRGVPFEELTGDDLDALLAVHVRGSFNIAQAAWPHLRAQGGGRLVFTASSGGILGAPNLAAYGAAKGGVLGLMNVLSEEGRAHGIRCNAILPNSVSRMAFAQDRRAMGDNPWAREVGQTFQPAYNAPLAAWLAHPQCESTHAAWSFAGGRIARVFVGVTHGWQGPIDTPPTLEQVAENWDAIGDHDRGYAVPTHVFDEFRIVAEQRAAAGQ